MGIKGSWLWLGGFPGCARPQPITLGSLLCFCAAPALGFCGVLAHMPGSGQGCSFRLPWGGFVIWQYTISWENCWCGNVAAPGSGAWVVLWGDAERFCAITSML